MHQMKKGLFFLLLFLFLFTTTYSQTAEGEEISFSVISKTQSYFEFPTGWSLQDNGKWASARNQIPHSDSRTNRKPSSRRKLGVESFNILELKKVLIGETQYNVLLITYQDGDYEFPLLQEGWEPFESMEFFVFEAESLANILPRDVPFNQPYAVNLRVFCAGRERNYDPMRLDDIIVGKIQATYNKTDVNAANLVFAVLPVQKDGNESVKFKMIRSFSKKSLSSWYLDKRNAEKLFDVSYYDAKFYQFKKFIRDSEVYNIPTSGGPDDFQSFFKWGILKYQAGNYDGAIDDFDAAFTFSPDTAFSLIYSYRGIARTKMGNYGTAIEDFDKAIDIQPSDIMGYSNWIKNYYNRGVSRFYTNDLQGACEDWNKAFDLGFGGALEYLERFCK